MGQNSIFSSEESRWNAVSERDRMGAEGLFYYAVKTTGIFCRPGCPSRLPRRKNIEFFERTEEAERAGYRPCKRCKPCTSVITSRL